MKNQLFLVLFIFLQTCLVFGASQDVVLKKVNHEFERLSELETRIERLDQENLSEVVQSWRAVVDYCLVPRPSLFSIDFNEYLKNEEKLSLDQLSEVEITELQTQLNQQLEELQSDFEKRRFKLLVNVSNLRSKAIGGSLNFVDFLDLSFYKDIIREAKVVPYRAVHFFINKFFELISHLGEGASGLLLIIQSLFALLFNVFLMPFLLWAIVRYTPTFVSKLAGQRSQSYNYQRGNVFSRYYGFLTTYMPWFLGYLFLMFAEELLNDTLVSEVKIIVPYFKFFVLYKIFSLLLKNEFKRLIFMSRSNVLSAERLKIERVTKVLGLFFFVSYSLLYATETTVGKAYIYLIVESALLWVGTILVVSMVALFNDEIAEAYSRTFKKPESLPNFLKSAMGRFLSLPVLISLLVYYGLLKLVDKLSKYEVTKKLFARISRHKLEAAGAAAQDADIEDLPQDYRELFTLDFEKENFKFIETSVNDLEKCKASISEWQNDKAEENSLLIYGEKGSGKTEILNQLNLEYKKYEDCEVQKVTVKEKVLTSSDVLEFFSELLNCDLSGGLDQLEEWDKSASKQIILLDNAHNMFIATVGGTEGFKTLLEIINLQLENLYIVATFNLHSWLYIDSIFRKNKYFRNTLKISPWKEEDIQALIQERHNLSSFDLLYDPAVFSSSVAHHSEEFMGAERRFFRILWEMSNGSPKAAIQLWLSALKPYGKRLKVGLPGRPSSAFLKELQTDAFFVYASIIRHDCLTPVEAVNTTNLPMGFVKFALKIGREQEFLEKNSQWSLQCSAHLASFADRFFTKQELLV